MLAIAKRTADRFHGELYVLNVHQSALSEADQAALEKQLALAREAGARVEVLTDEDPIQAILKFARGNRITQIFIGHSLREGLWNRLFGNPVDRLIRSAEGMDVCVFPH